jgi:hypothetical protein
VVTYTKLVAKTTITKELGEHVSAVMRWQLQNGQRLSDKFGGEPMTYLGSRLRELGDSS